MRRTLVWAAALLTASTAGAVALASPALASTPVISTDYNGDGLGDLAIGEPNRTVSGITGAGAVRVVYANSSGLNLVGSQFFTEDSPAVPGVVGVQSSFGMAIASGDFDGDTYADAAIAAPESSGSKGEVVVLYGSSAGLNGTAAAQAKAELLTPALFAPPGGPFYEFGRSLATADFNQDGFADLAIGVPSGAVGGGIAVVYGSANGLLPSVKKLWIDEDSPGIPGSNADGGEFGTAIATGDFNGDGSFDIGVGAPFESFSGIEGAGQLFAVLTDSLGNAGGAGGLEFDQDTPGMPDVAGTHDHFGAVVAAGDITGDGKAEFVASTLQDGGRGIVFVLPGSATGPTATGAVSFAGGIGDVFGASLALVNTDGNTMKELVIGIPGRTVSGFTGAGAVLVLPGTTTGPSSAGTIWTQDTTGVVDQAEAGDGFGSAVRGISNNAARVQRLTIGVTDESVAGCTHCGAVAALNGSATGLTATGNQFLTGANIAGGGFSDGNFAGSFG